MSKHFIAAIIVSLCSCPCISQTSGPPDCPARTHTGLVSFIKGNEFVHHFTKDLLRQDFEIVLSDTSYKVVSFMITLDVTVDNGPAFQAFTVTGSNVPVIEKAINRTGIDSGIFIIDRIVAEKNGICYSAKAFSFFITSEKIAAEKRTALPVCYANFKGLFSDDNVSHTIFNSDHTLELSDTSFKITGFKATWYIEDEEYAEVFSGDVLSPGKNQKTKSLGNLVPGSVVEISEIVIEKRGKKYTAQPFTMFCR